ncbi:MAG: hypothetical protein ABIH20_02730 [Candidatus Diapherotrites archaeon]
MVEIKKTIIILGVLLFSVAAFAAQVTYNNSDNTFTQQIDRGWNIVNDKTPKNITCNGLSETFSLSNGGTLTGWTVDRWYFDRDSKDYVLLDDGITQRIAEGTITEEDVEKLGDLFQSIRKYNGVFFFYSDQRCEITQQDSNPSVQYPLTFTLKNGYNFVALSSWITEGKNNVQEAFPGCDISGAWSWDSFNSEWDVLTDLPTGETVVIRTNSECSINSNDTSSSNPPIFPE